MAGSGEIEGGRLIHTGGGIAKEIRYRGCHIGSQKEKPVQVDVVTITTYGLKLEAHLAGISSELDGISVPIAAGTGNKSCCDGATRGEAVVARLHILAEQIPGIATVRTDVDVQGV